MVFEVNVAELGGEGQVLGGGSYKLLHLFGMEDLDPSCGFGLGFDRLLMLITGISNIKDVIPFPVYYKSCTI